MLLDFGSGGKKMMIESKKIERVESAWREDSRFQGRIRTIFGLYTLGIGISTLKATKFVSCTQLKIKTQKSKLTKKSNAMQPKSVGTVY